MLSPGTKLQERYLVERKLGEGGMGAVYAGIDERFGTPIALKEIIFDAANSGQRYNLVAAFEREAKSLAKARHEAIPFVRDYFFEGDRQFLIMELIEGDDLAELLQKNQRPFPVDSVADWMRQLLDALDYLHDLSPPMVHRDIKPQNLKITARKRLKLLDFGIAKSSEASAVQSITKTFVGATLTYSPIEQILRVIDPTFREFILLKHEARAKIVLAQNTDGRADLFAVGGTFYHLLTDRLPEEATKRTLAVWEGKPDPITHPSDLNPSVPRGFGDFLLKAMAIDRGDRFASAAEMLDALNAAASSRHEAMGPAAAATIPMFQVPTTPDASAPVNPTLPAPEITLRKSIGQPTEPLISNIELARSRSQTDWNDPVSSPSLGDTIPNRFPDPGAQRPVTIPEKPLPLTGPGKSKTTHWLASAVAAAGLLAILAVIGGVVMMNGSGAASNTPVVNRPTATPRLSASPTATPIPTPSADVYVSPTPAPTILNGGPGSGSPSSPKRPVKTPPPPKKSNKGGQDLNCIYTNSCK